MRKKSSVVLLLFFIIFGLVFFSCSESNRDSDSSISDKDSEEIILTGTVYKCMVSNFSETAKKAIDGDTIAITDATDDTIEIIHSILTTTICKKIVLDFSWSKELTVIKGNAFYYTPMIIGIVLPDGITTIGVSAFQYCDGLRSIKIPSTVKVIDYDAFYGCKKLKNIELPSNLVRLENSAFYECSSLTNIVIPKEIKEIKGQTFYKCSSLKKVTFADNSELTRIGGKLLKFVHLLQRLFYLQI